MQDFPELLELRNRLWNKVRSLPGVITVGIGSSDDQTALVVFVDELTVHRSDLPTLYENIPVVLEVSGKVKAHGE